MDDHAARLVDTVRKAGAEDEYVNAALDVCEHERRDWRHFVTVVRRLVAIASGVPRVTAQAAFSSCKK
jgi:hypothetical protein